MARSDLDEAEQIAGRGPMRLHRVDIALQRVQLALSQYDFTDARKFLDEAHELATKSGYERRRKRISQLKADLDIARIVDN